MGSSSSDETGIVETGIVETGTSVSSFRAALELSAVLGAQCRPPLKLAVDRVGELPRRGCFNFALWQPEPGITGVTLMSADVTGRPSISVPGGLDSISAVTEEGPMPTAIPDDLGFERIGKC